ncbi:hypothetical protein SAMD00019534_074700, partial [Acytostelium subglobosum LB1]|uniref:hypothetical protein n=1 Tax=Acytostelium subglobosum LB1 TaxID=1410327 RepID=UPI000644E85B
ISLLLLVVFVKASVDLSTCFSSRSTWYEAIEHGNCGYGPLMGPTGPKHRFVTAPASIIYNASYACGTCYEIDGPFGSQVVTVVDQCPDPGWCDTAFPHLDLSPQAFQSIGGSFGVVMTNAKKVSCDYVTGNIKLSMKDAPTTPSWFEFVVFNHRTGLDRVDIEQANGVVSSLKRQNYNFWTYSSNQPAQFPVIARVYDQFGARVDVFIASSTRAVISEGSGQFPDPASSFHSNCLAPYPVLTSGVVYQNGLTTTSSWGNPNIGWQDWSWSTEVNWCDKSVGGAANGSTCVACTSLTGGSIQIGTELPVKWANVFKGIEFYVKGTQSFNTLQFGYDTMVSIPVTTNWKKHTFTLDQVGAPSNLGRPSHLDFRSSTRTPLFYIDYIRLIPIN